MKLTGLKKNVLKVNDIVITKKNRNVYYIIKDFVINEEGKQEIKCRRIDDLYDYTIPYEDLELWIESK